VKVRVRLFALARQLAGAESIDVDLPDGASVRQLRDELQRTCPSLASLLPTMMIAVNEEYAVDSSRIPPGAAVAVIPPVSGG